MIKTLLENRLHPWRPVATGLFTLLVLALCGSLVKSHAAEDPPHRYLLVGGTGSHNIGVLAVDRDGAMSPVTGSPFTTGTGLSLAITPDAEKVYVASLEGAITGYRIGSDGALSPIFGAQAIIGAPVVGLAITPDGSTMFATIGGVINEVRSFSISPSGAIAPTGAPAASVPGLSALSLPVITPDTRHLFVTSFLANTVTGFVIQPDASLTRVGQWDTGAQPALPTVTPNGRFLYVSNEQTGDLSGYAIGADGSLTPTPGQPYSTGGQPHGTTYTPNSRRLYVPEVEGGTIVGFRIETDGALTPLPGSPYPAPEGTLPGRVVLSPDASRLFLIDALTELGTSRVHSYVIAPDGSLAPTGRPPVDTDVLFSDGPSSFITPNQGPTADLRLVDGHALTRTFSAQGSTDVDGTIARYDWDFGDGETATTTTQEVEHTYPSAGDWTVRVTVTDDEGCSTRLIFTGQTVTCDGGPKASATLDISTP